MTLLPLLFVVLALVATIAAVLLDALVPGLAVALLLLMAAALSWRLRRQRKATVARQAATDDTLSRRRSGAEQFANGHVKEALATYDRNLSLDVSNTGARGVPHRVRAILYTERGQIHFAQRQYQLALRDFQSAQEANPTFHPAMAWLAIVHYALRNLDEARIWWRRAVKHEARYGELDGLNWMPSQPGWLSPPIVEALAITALLNARRPPMDSNSP